MKKDSLRNAERIAKDKKILGVNFAYAGVNKFAVSRLFQWNYEFYGRIAPRDVFYIKTVRGRLNPHDRTKSAAKQIFNSLYAKMASAVIQHND